ncbi:hypothetical protein BDV96DRAFT_503596 [Lophiotrema nucula]|uniref:DUF7707 domain-containing protein n=1 Tax=Lophiotrema nucula TaxID=690887 RepID=A0A6A5YQL7_9PLEO|nr:hypothetical protein BDV96DRAFT_503596 [Lophiotrema nucula]
MLYATLTVAFATLASFVNAQLPNNIQPCCTISPNSVNSTVRESWCQAQKNTCPQICGGFSKLNSTCDSTTLTFNCICGDGTTPNMSDYQQSVPGQMCRQWFSACITASGDDLQEQEACKAVSCGNKTISAQQSSVASSSPTGSSGASTSSGGDAASATGAAPSSASSGAATAIAIAREYGTPLLAGGFAALFGLAL